MEEEKMNKRFTPDYIDKLLPNQVFVFGSNVLGYHLGGAAKMALNKFGAVLGEPNGLQGQSYAIPVDYGKNVRQDDRVKEAVEKFIAFAGEHQELFFLVTRVGCGNAGYKDDEMALFFKGALELENVSLPKSFVEAIEGKRDFNLERFIQSQELMFDIAREEIKNGRKREHWIWFMFPQMKGLGHSHNSEFYGISCKDEAQAYFGHSVLGQRLREITKILLDCKTSSAEHIFGHHDAKKVQSCMTLFDIVSPNDIFNDVLEKFFYGKRCEKTMRILGWREVKLQNTIKLSRLTITKDYSVFLSDYKKEVKMEPLVKAVYLLFLKHPEGIAFKCLPDYRMELADIYQKIKPYGMTERAIRSIEDVTNPLLNSINEKCSRVRAAFKADVDASILDQYIITGKSGEAKKIALPHELVVWE